jgi:hypothetical protein
MDIKEVVSLSELATRFSKAKGMEESGYQWLRQAPGRKKDKDEPVGNSLAVLKAIKSFNSSNKDSIEIYHARGYDGTNKRVMVIPKSEVIRLKGFILRGNSKKPGRKPTATEFRILGKVEMSKVDA